MINSKKPNLFETDVVEIIIVNFFQNFSNNSNFKLYSGNKYLGAVFAERFNRTSRDLHKKTVFEKADGNWINVFLQ